MKIIAVDDESAALHLFLEDVLNSHEDLEYRFFKDDPVAIVAYCAQNEVTGAFLDIHMPRVNGQELAKRLIEVRPKLKIVFVTGYNIDESAIDPELRDHVLGMAYKPFSALDFNKYIELMAQERPHLVVKTFGGFDCFCHGQLVRFSSNKSKELFAFLICENGKSVTMEDVLSALWPDKDTDKAKILYRDAVWRLRSTLNAIGFSCVNFGRAILSLDVRDIECDYYDLLAGKPGDYKGEFMRNYEWSLPIQYHIDYLVRSRK